MRPAGPSFADQAIQLDAREHQHAYDRAESNGQVKTFSAAPALLKAGQGAAGAAIRLGPELVTLAEKTPAALEAAAEATPKLWNATQAAALKAWPTLKWMVGVGAPAAQGASQLQSGVQGYVDASQKGMPAVARANLQAGAVGAASNATLATLGAGALAPALSQARLLRVLAGLRMSGQLLPQLGRIGAPALPGLAATAALVGSARADRGLELNAPGPAYQRLLASGPAPQLSPVQQSFADSSAYRLRLSKALLQRLPLDSCPPRRLRQAVCQACNAVY